MHLLTVGAQDCANIKMMPYTAAEAQTHLEEVLSTSGAERGPAIFEALQRFLFKGQVVRIEGVDGPVAYRNGRVGLIVHTLQDEQGRYTVELHEFEPTEGKDIRKVWVRLPPTNIKLQVGMCDGLFFDNRFEKAAMNAGMPIYNKLPKHKRNVATAPNPPEERRDGRRGGNALD